VCELKKPRFVRTNGHFISKKMNREKTTVKPIFNDYRLNGCVISKLCIFGNFWNS
jgi:hypothetical protein